MRIIGGQFRGLTIKTLRGDQLRPTSEQMRETLFDVLGPSVEGARFLDAYAGSGAVGLEALSRGARDVVFIEHHRAAVALIRENARALGIGSDFEVLACHVPAGLERLEEEGAHFDSVFLDPPYAEIREYHHVLRLLSRSTLIHERSMIIAEHSRHVVLEDRYGELECGRRLRHGDTQLSFYRRPAKLLSSLP
jgi:16S rRNA (guanine966-N2)-methyltransferase